MLCLPGLVLDEITATLNTLRHEKELTDVVLVCGQKEFPAHKVVLAASSPYFHHLFGDKTRKNDVLQLTGVQCHALDVLLDYIYTGNLNLPTEMNKIEENLFASNQLQISDFGKHAEMELSTRVTTYNYAIYWIMADQYGAEYLQTQIECFAAFNLKKLYKLQDFKSIGGKFLLRICECAALNDVNPKTVISAVLSWFNHDLNARKLHMTSIVPYLRMERLDCSILHELWEKEPLVHKIKSLASEVKRALKLKCQNAGDHNACSCSAIHSTFVNKMENRSLPKIKLTSSSNMQPVPILCFRRTGRMGIIPPEQLITPEHDQEIKKSETDDGSETTDDASSDEEEEEDEEEDGEEEEGEEPENLSSKYTTEEDEGLDHRQDRNYPTLAVIGRKRSSSGVIVRALDLENCVWLPPTVSTPEVHSKNLRGSILSCSAHAVFADILYLAGGYDTAQKVSDTFVAYRVFSSTVSRNPDLLTARALAGADILGKYLYVVGGLGMFGKALSLVERFDFEQKMWEYVSPLPKPSWEMGVTSCRGRLYSLGGRCKGEWSSLCLCYNPDTDQWQRITNLPKEYHDTYPIITTYKEHIYSIGHHNPQHKAFIFRFDPVSCHWIYQKTVVTESTKIFGFLPWNGNLWVVETTGSVHRFQINFNKWIAVNSFGKGITFPLYTAILIRSKSSEI